ncbi:MAG: lysophospholipid acyltransferase family protein [Desulfobacterales bacterium]|jgi:KDO2-lipid IV(A) lauroyltransferase
MSSDSPHPAPSRSADDDSSFSPRIAGGLRSRIAHLDFRRIRSLGALLGKAIYVTVPYLRHNTRENLRLIHPGWSEADIVSFSKRVFHHFGIVLIEMVQMGFMTREECRNRIHLEGREHIAAAVGKGRGVVMISAHLGSWEIAWHFYPLFFNRPLTGVAKPFRFKQLTRWFHRRRTRFGNRVIYKKGAFEELRRTLRQGGSVAIFMDMNRTQQGVPVHFMGHRTKATPAAAMLALRCRSPVLPGFTIRQPDGSFRLFFLEPIEIRRTGNLRDDLQTYTQAMTDVIETVVQRHPEQWLWSQKRWKSFHPELYQRSHSLWKNRKIKRWLKGKPPEEIPNGNGANGP